MNLLPYRRALRETGSIDVLSVSLLLFLQSPATLATNYDSAITASKTAFLIQSGVQHDIDLMSAKGRDLVLNNGVVPKKPLALILGAYKVYRDKSFSFSLFPSSRLTLHTNSIGYEFHW